MVNLDLSNLDTISNNHLRVLQAMEQGMRNHDYVPVVLIQQISNISSVAIYLGDLHRLKLVACKNHTTYTLTYLGFDYLALTVLSKRGIFDIVGSRVGVGKEADVYIATNSKTHKTVALKFHKLGLSSFKKAKEKRNYLEHRQNASWMHMSRLSAMREFGFLATLQDNFDSPKALSLNRHCVVMEFIPGFKMACLRGLSPEWANDLGWNVWWKMVELLRRGVIHGDMNEYNIIVQVKDELLCQIKEEKPDTQELPEAQNEIQDVEGEEMEEAEEVEEKEVEEQHFNVKLPVMDEMPPLPNDDYKFFTRVVIIDFPQMIQTTDKEAEYQFDRDVESYENFLNRRFQAGLKLPRFAQFFHLVKPKDEEQIETTEKFVKKAIEKQGQVYEESKAKDVKSCVKKEMNRKQQQGTKLVQKGQVKNKNNVKDWE
ncbi:RIO_kinase 2 [Hexamita inflata]|uniref:non-specific serine/threonine protein kinase n=1 Tax=Hexamita inflata TaxID=28002 RepID=A0AA86NDJ6_9EUKA|nr:RIO kinase 2 [Hexamita inflata]